MANTVLAILWIAVPFGVAVLVALTLVTGRGSPESVSYETKSRVELRPVGRTI